jgi:hypothetical protein
LGSLDRPNVWLQTRAAALGSLNRPRIKPEGLGSLDRPFVRLP